VRGVSFFAALLAAPVALGAPTSARAASNQAAPSPRNGAPQGAKADAWVGGRLTGRFSPNLSEALAPPEGEARPWSSWHRPVGFAGLGVGAVLIGAGVYSSVRLRGAENQWAEPSFLAYRANMRSPQESCNAARRGFTPPHAGAASAGQVQSLCAQLSTFETLQYAFYGAGALLGGLGALFFLSSGPSREASSATASAKRAEPPKPSWRLQPSVGRTAATLTLHVRF
jgi:hypothetical protein